VPGGGGHTPGFWSNKNGARLLGSDDLALLAGLNLRNADGTHFNPATVAQFQSWLSGGNAQNMALQLSRHTAAMAMNVHNGFVNGEALIQAPGAGSADAQGLATVNAILAEANAELGAHGSTPSGSAYRAYQESLKNALDAANNNTNFACP
jgi:hypothetical protein